MELEELLKIVVCPRCHEPLEHVRAESCEGLACAHCAVVYPVRDEIPILLVEDAIPKAEWPK